jgi:hypothetical protein
MTWGRLARAMAVLMAVVVIPTARPPPATIESSQGIHFRLARAGPGIQAAIAAELQSALPAAAAMIDAATETLARGRAGMTPADRELFCTFFDPAGTGTIDDEFVYEVLANYCALRRTIERGLDFEFAGASDRCVGQRLYYTDLVKVHVCPYLLTETRAWRKARCLVHETVHLTLLALERPYYWPGSSDYAALTPRGPWIGHLPVVGRLFIEIARADTLHSPEAYAWFAAQLTDQCREPVIRRPQPTPLSPADLKWMNQPDPYIAVREAAREAGRTDLGPVLYPASHGQ